MTNVLERLLRALESIEWVLDEQKHPTLAAVEHICFTYILTKLTRAVQGETYTKADAMSTRHIIGNILNKITNTVNLATPENLVECADKVILDCKDITDLLKQLKAWAESTKEIK